jgi:hypothetical protein
MKKLAVSVVALATVFAFTSCNSEDTVAPVITVPDNALVIDLGDTEAALEGVTASDDKDKDVTTYLTVEGVDYVGIGTLTYSAKDKANNEGTAERAVTIKAGKLKGTYLVDESGPSYETGNDTTIRYSFTGEEHPADNTTLSIKGFFGNPNYVATFKGDGKSTTLNLEPLNVNVGTDASPVTMTLTGTIEYIKKSATEYVLSSGKTKATYSNGQSDENYSCVYTRP